MLPVNAHPHTQLPSWPTHTQIHTIARGHTDISQLFLLASCLSSAKEMARKPRNQGGWLGGWGLMFWGWQQWVKGMGMAL